MAKAKLDVERGICRSNQQVGNGNCETAAQRLESVYAKESYDATYDIVVTNSIPDHCYNVCPVP